MTLQNQHECNVARETRRMLQDEYESARTSSAESDRVREATLQSLTRLINQLTEEIVRFEAHAGTSIESQA